MRLSLSSAATPTYMSDKQDLKVFIWYANVLVCVAGNTSFCFFFHNVSTALMSLYT